MSSVVIPNPTRNLLGFETTLTQAVCEILNSPRALMVHTLIKYKEWDQLATMTCDSRNYRDVGAFADDYLVSNLMRKSTSMPSRGPEDLKAEALRRFYAAELLCKGTNDRFLSSEWVPPTWWHAFTKNLSRILGPVSSAAKALPGLVANGPGASIGVRGLGLVPSDKFDTRPTLTEEQLPYYEAIVGETMAEYRPRRCVRVVKGNRFFSVPKDSITERGACTEPTVSMMGQLALGEYIRRRLLKWGVDIRTQEWNQALAEYAAEWRLATIDLSQASDLMAWGFLLQALSLEWFSLLSLLSCRFTLMPDGSWVELEKFCSMGNGFTFALQTAVFEAIVLTFVKPEDRCVTAVYGDDIIVPQAQSRDVIDALEFSGFRVNTRKSYLAGSFFESCGTDWFLGRNVRPFNLQNEEGCESVPIALTVLNALRRWSSRRNALDKGHNEWREGCDRRFFSLWKTLKQHVPHPWANCRVPLRLGDTGILSDSSELITRPLPESSWEGVEVLAVRLEPVTLEKRTFGVLLAALMNAGDEDHRVLNPIWGSIAERLEVELIGLPPSFRRPTLGREPRRGLFGQPVAGWTHIWDVGPGLAW